MRANVGIVDTIIKPARGDYVPWGEKSVITREGLWGRVLRWIPIACLALMLGGCMANPLQTAMEAPSLGFTGNVAELEAFALYGTFTSTEEALAKVIVKEGIPDRMKAAMKAADAEAKPVADKMNNAGLDAALARAELPVEPTLEEQAALTALERVVRQRVDKARPIIEKFSGLVRAFMKGN